MPIQYKFDILSALKEKGYTSYRMRKDKIIGERTIQQLRESQLVSWDTLAKICEMLHCKPGDLIDYVPESDIAVEKEEEEV